MGFTAFEVEKTDKIIIDYDIKNVLQFGEQNNYSTKEQNKPPFMREWYEKRGVECHSLDMAGDNGAYKFNWAYPLVVFKEFDFITDGGSSEHTTQKDDYISESFHNGYINSVYPNGEPTKEEIESGYFECWKNKHNMLKLGGIMFNINPLTGHWPLHGYSYIGEYFYKELVKVSGYELVEDGVVCGSGNCDSGKNVYGIIKKVSDTFPTIDEFYEKLPIFKS